MNELLRSDNRSLSNTKESFKKLAGKIIKQAEDAQLDADTKALMDSVVPTPSEPQENSTWENKILLGGALASGGLTTAEAINQALQQPPAEVAYTAQDIKWYSPGDFTLNLGGKDITLTTKTSPNRAAPANPDMFSSVEANQVSDIVLPLQEFSVAPGSLRSMLEQAVGNGERPVALPLFLDKDGAIRGVTFEIDNNSDVGKHINETLQAAHLLMQRGGQVHLEMQTRKMPNGDITTAPYLRIVNEFRTDPNNPNSVRYIPDSLFAFNLADGQRFIQYHIPVPGMKGSQTGAIRVPQENFADFQSKLKKLYPNVNAQNPDGLILGQVVQTGNDTRIASFAAKGTGVLFARDFGNLKGTEIKQTPSPDGRKIGTVNATWRVVTVPEIPGPKLAELKARTKDRPDVFWDGAVPYAVHEGNIYYLTQSGNNFGWVKASESQLSVEKGPTVPALQQVAEGPTITDNKMEAVTEGNFHGFETTFKSKKVKFMTDIQGLDFIRFNPEKFEQMFQILGLNPLSKNTRFEILNWENKNPDQVRGKKLISLINDMAIAYPKEGQNSNEIIYQVYVDPKSFGDIRFDHDVGLQGVVQAFLYQLYVDKHPESARNMYTMLNIGNTAFPTNNDIQNAYLGMSYKPS